ncbi:MAG: DUF3416 domain-containing protein [Candidatus Caenarcaniphilales bacterium]|nr:DUF3416 domain-containing protein [Candidatus Caenarcaniphilales bacterium]
MFTKLPEAIIIENVSPEINAGEFPIKVVCGEKIDVSANILKDGHEIIRAQVLYKEVNQRIWKRKDLKFEGYDTWRGSFYVEQELLKYVYTIEAWVDPIATWVDGIVN